MFFGKVMESGSNRKHCLAENELNSSVLFSFQNLEQTHFDQIMGTFLLFKKICNMDQCSFEFLLEVKQLIDYN